MVFYTSIGIYFQCFMPKISCGICSFFFKAAVLRSIFILARKKTDLIIPWYEKSALLYKTVVPGPLHRLSSVGHLQFSVYIVGMALHG